MNRVTPHFCPRHDAKSRVAIFMSGGGTNAEKILEQAAVTESKSYDVVLIFTDRPTTSRARELAAAYGLQFLESDISKFYLTNGCRRVTIATPDGKRLREQWTRLVREQLRPHDIDFILFAGFIPLTNIAADFSCLNIHPGDLTYEKGGSRYLTGLHTVPIERAILEGLDYLRSSVILARPYFESEDNMDNGPILGISEKIPIDFLGHDLSDLRDAFESRPEPKSGRKHDDALRTVALANLENLKVNGDWVVFPRVVEEFAEAKYGVDAGGVNYYRADADWIAVKAVVYGTSQPQPILVGQ